ncbi:hypothetical protein E2C01_001794 [Portunus trituberculatus]|uniref:Uncharacterized protein n=1 Tax=Portunus trituberculatus TaxID=210409 RepID=A0A5B7CK70_PORTR|nr:hypothetical protein [Portunus trituberculatus]
MGRRERFFASLRYRAVIYEEKEHGGRRQGGVDGARHGPHLTARHTTLTDSEGQPAAGTLRFSPPPRRPACPSHSPPTHAPLCLPPPITPLPSLTRGVKTREVRETGHETPGVWQM